jgi:hypothetical protein
MRFSGAPAGDIIQFDMGTMSVNIPDPAEERLRRQASAAGKPLEQLAAEVLIAQATPTLREISGAVYQRFLSCGMTEDELAEILEREDHAARGVPYGE